MYVYVPHAYLMSSESEKSITSDSLGMKLQTDVSPHVSSGTEPGLSERAASALNH